jgi:UDP-N-acetylglucosamine--N-acetylmuramyl-(pentapeptide) pyrophosphoryl-undecaprenol N-acetylglucosamine transferase
MPRKPNGDLLALPARLRASVKAATEVLDRTQADVLVGFGGYVSLPGYLAARRRHIPLVVHEANAKAGLANRLAARLTPFVAETTAGSLPHAESIGLPLRPAIVALNRSERRVEAATYFGLDPQRPTVLVFGGSQGARSLNSAMAGAAVSPGASASLGTEGSLGTAVSFKPAVSSGTGSWLAVAWVSSGGLASIGPPSTWLMPLWLASGVTASC